MVALHICLLWQAEFCETFIIHFYLFIWPLHEMPNILLIIFERLCCFTCLCVKFRSFSQYYTESLPSLTAFCVTTIRFWSSLPLALEENGRNHDINLIAKDKKIDRCLLESSKTSVVTPLHPSPKETKPWLRSFIKLPTSLQPLVSFSENELYKSSNPVSGQHTPQKWLWLSLLMTCC